MSNIDKIKAEIERLKAENRNIRCQHNENYCTGYDDAFSDLLPFIDSLPEEKPSEDLEEAAEEYAYKGISDELKPLVKPLADEIIKQFIAGAEWQKEQMMKEAMEGEIGYWNQRGLSIRLDQSLEKLGYGEDTEVKIIIVKR